ncbi:MAG: hypothetical protein Ct9H300mP9_3770 [Candidatus Neomarinimicrobiota bacterium]|nr:MAG: hypothetical protein Ct9H300mP9_3770 [Candidatus Neomarinimicrobiota bacterium]
MYGAGDDGNWDLEFSGSQSVNMSGTSVSASVYPSSAINYTPGGANYWWEIKVEFYQEPEEETGGGFSVLTLNSSNITLYKNTLIVPYKMVMILFLTIVRSMVPEKY